MSIHKTLKLAERVIHPSSIDTPEGKIAAKLVNKILDAEGCTLSALIYKTYEKALPQAGTTAKQFRAKIADLEAKQADLEAERDLALMAAQENAEAVRQTVALEREKAALAADKADLLAQVKAQSEATLHNAAMAAEIASKDARIAALETQLAEALTTTAVAPVSHAAPIAASDGEPVHDKSTLDEASEHFIEAIEEFADADANSVVYEIRLPESIQVKLNEWVQGKMSLWKIAIRLSRELRAEITRSMARKLVWCRWTLTPDGYYEAPAL